MSEAEIQLAIQSELTKMYKPILDLGNFDTDDDSNENNGSIGQLGTPQSAESQSIPNLGV